MGKTLEIDLRQRYESGPIRIEGTHFCAKDTRIKELELLGQSVLTVLGTGRMRDEELVRDYGELGLDVVKRFRAALAGKGADPAGGQKGLYAREGQSDHPGPGKEEQGG